MDSMHPNDNLSSNNSRIEDEFDNCIDDKLCVYETIISGGYIKQEACDTEDKQENSHDYVKIKDENVDDLPVVDEDTVLGTTFMTDTNENDPIRCEECGDEYDLYCPKCPMLLRIFNRSNPHWEANIVTRTLPETFLCIRETSAGVGILALRAIPKGVVFGPCEGLNSTKDDGASKLTLKDQDYSYAKDPIGSNWMQYIRRADQNSHWNLTSFQYQDRLYYRSHCHISVGDELSVCWGSGSEENGIEDTEDGLWRSQICERLDDTYACTLCCVGYKSICHLAAHNSRCPQKRNQKDFCKEITQCVFCKIYLDEKEYSDHHVDQCYESNKKDHQTASRSPGDTDETEPYRCKTCDKQFEGEQMLLEHGRKVHDEKKKKHKCPKCDFESIFPFYIGRHLMNMHGGDKQFKCPRCAFKTYQRDDFQHHLRYHEDTIKCESCNIEFWNKQSLVRHKEEAHADADKTYSCSECEFRTCLKYAFNQHFMRVHSESKRLFTCTLCPYKAMTNSNLKRHMSIHDSKLFACTICLFKTKKNGSLKRHVATHHNDDKPFKCDVCPQTFKVREYLTTHKRNVHSKDSNLICARKIKAKKMRKH